MTVEIHRLPISNCRLPICPELPKSAGDVILSQLFIGGGEYLLSRVYFDQLAEEEEGRRVGNARRLLHVVRHDHDRVLLFQIEDQLLNLRGCDWVECRSR